MTFQSNPKVDDETRHRPAVTIDTYHYKIHEGWAYDAGVNSQVTDLSYMTFCTPQDPNVNVHFVIDYGGEKGVIYELWEGVTPPLQVPILATAVIIGNDYVIETLGTTDFMLSGSISNEVGTAFTATAIPIGTGTVLDSMKKLRKKNRLVTAAHGENACRFANRMKEHMNAHAADITQHSVADIVNFPITTPDATDKASLITLTAALQTAYIAHHSDALLAAAWVNHIAQFVGVTASMILTTAPTTTSEAKYILEELQRKYNIHDNSAISHTLAAVNSFGKVFGGSQSTSQNSIIVNATGLGLNTSGDRFTILVPGTTDFTLLGAKDSIAGTVFTHNGVVGIGTGTMNGHHLGVATFGITAAGAFTGGEKIVDSFAVKGTNSPNTGEHILRHNTCYGIKVHDPALNVAPLGFLISMFEVPEN